MPTLLDTIDRFNYASSSIRSLTLSQPSGTNPGPFTAAILDLTLSDLLREADDAEYGLFSFVKESSDAPTEAAAAQGKVGWREFRGATPLRPKRVAGTNREEEPEVYAEVALKYLDRFHAVKPMPQTRTHLESLINRLHHVRENLDKFQTSLAEAEKVTPESQVAEEERRISDLKSRVIQLRKRRDALTAKHPGPSKPQSQAATFGRRPAKAKSKITSPPSAVDSPSVTVATPTTRSSFHPDPPTKLNPRAIPPRRAGPSSSKSIPHGIPTTPEQANEDNERLFWSGGQPPKIVNRVDSLLDEEPDMSAMDALMSPPPAKSGLSRVSATPTQRVDGENNLSEYEVNEDEGKDEDEDEGSGEPTIIVSKLGLNAAPVPGSPTPPRRPDSQLSGTEPQTPVQDSGCAWETGAPPSTGKKVRRMRITAEVERVCTKIWNTIADLLVPGNNFTSPGKRPPNAKDTITVLQTIAAQPFPDPSNVSSPSTRSTLSSLLGIEALGPAGGSPHQIMTAQVLVSLLTAPNHGMPLTALKALLASKAAVPSPGPDAGREAKQSAAALGASAAQAGTRALYGCVAKKLIKIDRGGGGQIVKFD